VDAAKRIVNSGKESVIDIDLSKFFDGINHDRLIYLLSLSIIILRRREGGFMGNTNVKSIN